MENTMNTNMTETNVMTIGEITFDKECGIPTAEVLVSGKVSGYLTPFRAYCFQVSGTKGGQGAYGSSQVIGLRKVANMTSDISEPSNLNMKHTCEELLRGQAMIALYNHARMKEAALDLETRAEDDATLSNGEISDFLMPTRFDMFVEECLIWLRSL